MDLLPTEEQQQIIDTAASFLADTFPVRQLLSLEQDDTTFTRQHLKDIADLGWLGIGLPDDYGGVGYGLPEEALLFVELGRSLMPPSLLGSVLGARVAALAGDSASLHGLLAGALRVSLGTPRAAKCTRIDSTVDGEFLVFEAADTDLVLVADEGGAALFAASLAESAGRDTSIDGVVDASCVTASAIPALCFVPTAQDAVFLRGSLLVSAMLLGIAEATLQRSVDYAREREQFGKPIGSFQAVKHYCAEMAVRCESVRAMLYHASITLQEDTGAGTFDAHCLKALAIDAAQNNANTAVQIHGGMGYTQEMDIHLYVKRAQLLGTLFGSERLHLQRLLDKPAP